MVTGVLCSADPVVLVGQVEVGASGTQPVEVEGLDLGSRRITEILNCLHVNDFIYRSFCHTRKVDLNV